MTTRPYRFPQEYVESTGGGPDFPGSAGDRERGKFRPSATPRLTQVAVTGDDGQSVTRTTDELLSELVMWQRATVLALSLLSQGGEFSIEDVTASFR